MPHVFKRLSIAHTVGGSALFLVDRKILKDIVIPPGELRDASVPAYCYKGLLTDGTFTGAQAMTRPHCRSTDADRSVSSTDARNSANYFRLDQVQLQLNNPCGGKLGTPRQQHY